MNPKWITIVISEFPDISITNGDKGQMGMVIQTRYANMKKDKWAKHMIELVESSFNKADEE